MADSLDSLFLLSLVMNIIFSALTAWSPGSYAARKYELSGADFM